MVSITYFKRYRMEAELRPARPAPELSAGCLWLPWDEAWLETHAEVKWAAFRDEVDAQVFPSLATLSGCRELMRAIVRKPGFCPQATWLVAGLDGYCATVQGLCEPKRCGAIQNLGVVPGQRGHGLGAALLCKAMDGFRRAGMRRVVLEVTADNERAVALYRRYGFVHTKTVYRALAGNAECGMRHAESGAVC
jgi:ribosomal protein S18 acetylase RimI-like enzyme